MALRKVKLTIFDLDHTLLKVNSSFKFGTYLFRQRYFSFFSFITCLFYYARHKLLGLSIERLHQKTFSILFKGRCLKEIQHFVKQFLDKQLNDMFYVPALQRLQEAQQKGEYTVILSSSPDFLVGPIAEKLLINHWKGTLYVPDDRGVLSHLASILEGRAKADFVSSLASRLKVDRKAITVYSDSFWDLPVLNMAGKAIGVVPDVQLKRICREKGWEII